jgi:hypothetical protein
MTKRQKFNALASPIVLAAFPALVVLATVAGYRIP